MSEEAGYLGGGLLGWDFLPPSSRMRLGPYTGYDDTNRQMNGCADGLMVIACIFPAFSFPPSYPPRWTESAALFQTI